jgi:hypothetical protein
MKCTKCPDEATHSVTVWKHAGSYFYNGFEQPYRANIGLSSNITEYETPLCATDVNKLGVNMYNREN